MTKYLLTYDLSKPGRNYDDLIEHLETTYGSEGHILGSVWLIETTESSVAVRDAAKAYLDANDKMLVIGVSSTAWATRNLTSASDWLNS